MLHVTDKKTCTCRQISHWNGQKTANILWSKLQIFATENCAMQQSTAEKNVP